MGAKPFGVLVERRIHRDSRRTLRRLVCNRTTTPSEGGGVSAAEPRAQGNVFVCCVFSVCDCVFFD